MGPASSVTKNGRVKWFGHVERKDDAKSCMTTDVVGVVQVRLGQTATRRILRVWACPKRMHSLGIKI